MIGKHASIALSLLSLSVLVAAEPKTTDKKPAPEKSATFYVPAGAKVIDKKMRNVRGDGAYVLRKGAIVELRSGRGVCIVEAGAEVSALLWQGAVIVKDGGGVSTAGGPVYYEEGARFDNEAALLGRREKFQHISLAPQKPFALKGEVREGGQLRAGVKVCAYALDGRRFVETTTDREGRFEFHPDWQVGYLLAKLGKLWDSQTVFRGDPQDAKFRQSVRGVRGWEWERKEGYWGTDATVSIVHTERAELVQPTPLILPAHERPVTAVVFSADGSTLVSASQAGRLCVWDVKTAKVLRRFAPDLGPVPYQKTPMALDARGSLLAAFGRDGVRVWDVKNGRLLHERSEGSWSVQCAAFSSDGRALALGDADGTIHLWNLESGRTRTMAKAHKDGVTTLAFSKDDKALISAGTVWRSIPNIRWKGADAVRVWDCSTERLIRAFRGDVERMALSMDGRYQAGAGFVREDKTDSFVRIVSGHTDIFIWEHGSERPLAKIIADADALAFTPDNRLLLTATAANVRVWETNTGQEVLTCPLPQQEVTTVALSPDGRTRAAGQEDGRVCLWNVWPSGLYVPEDRQYSDAEWEKKWTDLASDKAATAYRTLWTLQREPARAMTLLRSRLRPARDEAPVKEAEQRRISSEELRSSRAVYLLEQIGSPEARELLQNLAKGAIQARQTREAKAALARLVK